MEGSSGDFWHFVITIADGQFNGQPDMITCETNDCRTWGTPVHEVTEEVEGTEARKI